MQAIQKELAEYFEQAEGVGVLATAGDDGAVDAAIYARPHILDDGSVAFIMADKLSHQNITENPHATYAFIESGGGYQGKRLHLTKTGEETDPEKIQSLRRRVQPKGCTESSQGRYLVHFQVDRVRPLVGD